jgi:metal-sulfur cluster biosynthetic enzyme
MTECTESVVDVWRALDEVIDPCLAAAGHRISVVDLGLISRVDAMPGAVEIGITFTEVGCPFTHRVIDQIESRVLGLRRFETVRVVPEWRPAWTPERMNDRARAALSESRTSLRLRLSRAGNCAG